MDPSLGPYIHCKLEQLPGHPGIDMHLRVQERRIEDSYDTAAGAATASWDPVTKS
jgi:hypothetical protein